MRRGIRLIISGFAGVGKGTVIKELMRQHDGYVLSVSATTRQPRNYEEHGREYFFLSKDEFDRMVQEDAFLEYAHYTSESYGTPKRFVEEQMDQGKDVILEIEVQGARQVREKYPDTPMIFIVPPSMEELKRRLIGRGTETPDKIAKRLARAREEAAAIEEYDYILVNDEAAACAERLHGLVQSIRLESGRNRELVEELRREAEDLLV